MAGQVTCYPDRSGTFIQWLGPAAGFALFCTFLHLFAFFGTFLSSLYPLCILFVPEKILIVTKGKKGEQWKKCDQKIVNIL